MQCTGGILAAGYVMRAVQADGDGQLEYFSKQ
jgi:hypothetical protein